jgi:hypothetical protein
LVKWIDYTIDHLPPRLLPAFTYGITNIVACMPEQWTPDPNGRGIVEFGDSPGEWKLRPPVASEAACCSPRLSQIFDMVRPIAIIRLGKVAQKLDKHTDGYHRLDMDHPAYVLRCGGENSQQHKRSILTLTEFITEVLTRDTKVTRRR